MQEKKKKKEKGGRKKANIAFRIGHLDPRRLFRFSSVSSALSAPISLFPEAYGIGGSEGAEGENDEKGRGMDILEEDTRVHFRVHGFVGQEILSGSFSM